MKEKNYLQQDKATLNEQRTNADNTLKKSTGKTVPGKNEDWILDELKLNMHHLEQSNLQLCQDNDALKQQLSRLKKEQQKNITTALLKAGEKERKRVSEALHDSVSQLLYAIKMQLDQLSLSQQPTPLFNNIYDLLDSAVQETRNISFALAPSILTDFGLPTTITELANRLSTPQLQINAQVKGFTERLDLFMETCIFRIIQELINNCMKHSGASVINIFICKSDVIEILFTDNGRGFNAKQQETKPTGSGFSSIKNRLGLYNGSLDIQSTPGEGTTVIINLAMR